MVAIAALSAAGLSSSLAHAAITGSSASVNVIAEPTDAQLNVITSATNAFAWNEQQGITLRAALRVDAVDPGQYDQTADLVNALIAAGTTVNSHYIHFDSPGSQVASVVGSVTFDQDILGVIATEVATDSDPGKLDESDFLGAPTLYPDGLVNRGLEFTSNGDGDRFTISADRRTVEFNLRISSPGDFFRVVTAVPAPGSAALLGLGGLLTARRRR
jgi:hypothetical protein